jgi:Zn-finger protein
MYAKQQQLAVAAHGPGQYVRDSGECAVCHSHQGWLERLETGEWSYSAGSVDDVVPMNCRTCHMIHTTYTAADYARRWGVPVAFRASGRVRCPRLAVPT